MGGISVRMGAKREGMEKREVSLAGYGLISDKNEIKSEVENTLTTYGLYFECPFIRPNRSVER